MAVCSRRNNCCARSTSWRRRAAALGLSRGGAKAHQSFGKLDLPRQSQGCGTPVILRVHREGYHSVDGIRSELAWMRALQAEAGVKTPQAIPARDGTDIQTVAHPALNNPRNCVLFEFIDGIEPPQDNLIPPFRQLGEVTGRCHNHSRRLAAAALLRAPLLGF